VNPGAYAVDVLKSVLFKNAGLSSISGDILFLAAVTASMMSVAILIFSRMA